LPILLIIIVLILVPQIYALNHNTGIYNDTTKYLVLKDKIPKDIILVCCNWQETCEFLMPEREVLQKIDFKKIRDKIKENKTVLYLRSPLEKSIGCGEHDLRKFDYHFNISKIKHYKFIKIYRITNKY
jgi:hypothetical protein